MSVHCCWCLNVSVRAVYVLNVLCIKLVLCIMFYVVLCIKLAKIEVRGPFSRVPYTQKWILLIFGSL